ncbi:hypothetical protein RQP46_009554 [Phenoliferia psychrophenolica]
MPAQNPIHTRLNVFGDPLMGIQTCGGPTTGFFRNNLADASPMDPASHTVAAILSPAFLTFSASRGNDLRSLFPTSGPLSPAGSAHLPLAESPVKWAICAGRWQEALEASVEHPEGEAIVPRVVLEATHEQALKFAKMEDLQRFAVGGSGEVKGDSDGEGEKEVMKPRGERIGR